MDKDFVSVYVAASNMDANLIAVGLNEIGIEAFAVEDISPGGLYSLGTISELHRPEVFVRPADVAAAREFISEFEAGRPVVHAGDRQYCYHCGADLQGNTSCPACGQNLAWDEQPRAENSRRSDVDDEVRGLDRLRAVRKPLALLMLTPLFIGAAVVVLAVLSMIYLQIARVFQ